MADPNEVGGWVIDPNNPNRATYTDEFGVTYEAFREEPTPDSLTQSSESSGSLAPQRSGFDRFKDSFSQAVLEGFGGQVAQKWYDWTDYGKEELRSRFPGKPEEWYEEQSDRVISLARRGVLEEIEERQKNDPTWRPDDSFIGNVLAIDRWGPMLAGAVVGSAGPESLINPGGTALRRIGAQALVGGGSDAGYQALNVSQGVRDEFSTEQMLLNAVSSAGLQSVLEVPSFIRRLFSERGVDTTPSANPLAEADLTETSAVRMTPEQEAEYTELLRSGTLQDILAFFDDKEGMSVDPQAMAEWVAARNAGEAVSPTLSYQNRVDPLENELAAEANRFLANRPTEDDLLQQAGFTQGPRQPELSAEERLVQEANEFLKARGSEPVVEFDPPEEVLPSFRPEEAEARLADEANAFIRRRGEEADTAGTVEASRPASVSPDTLSEVDVSGAPKVNFRAAVTRAEKAAEAINDAVGEWRNPPRFEVVNSIEDISDPSIRSSIDPDAIGATLPDGRVIINMGNVDSPEVLSAVTFHEALGHHGLQQRFGDELDSVLADLYHNGARAFTRKVDDWIKKHPDLYVGSNQVIRATEEVLAEMSEAGRLPRTIIDKIKDFLKNLGREMGLNLRYSDREIRSILSMAHDAVVNGAGRDVSSNGFRYMKRPKRPSASAPASEWVKFYEDRIKHSTARIARAEAEGELNTVAFHRHLIEEAENELARYRNIQGGRDASGRPADLEEGGVTGGDLSLRQGARNAYSRMSDEELLSSLDGTAFPDLVREELDSRGIRYMKRKPRPNIGAINPNKLDTLSTPEEIDEILHELSAVNPSRKTTWKETEEEALARGLTPSRIAKRRGADGLASYLRAANIALANQIDKVSSIQKRIETEGYSVALHERFLEEAARLKAVHARVNYDNSEVGRALNILKRVSQSRQQAKSISEALEGLDNGVLGDPEQFMKYLKLLQEQVDAGNQSGAIRLVSDVFKPNAEDFIFRVWYNMLLSAPPTHMANFLGTAGNFVMDLLENTGAAIIGQGKRFSNADRVRGREVAYRVYGALKGLTDAVTWSRTRESLNTGLTGNMPNMKIEGTNVYTGDDPILGFASGFLEAPTRALAGADEWWRNVLQLSNIYGLAVRNAGNKGLKGRAFWDEVSDLIANPTKEMIEASNHYTRVLQFMDKPSGLARSLISAQTPKVDSTVPGRAVRGALKAAIPFIRTPDSLIRTSIRRAGPLGVFERENIAGWKAGGAERDKVKARLIMGSFLSFYLAAQAYNGSITGEGPSDYRKRAEWLATHQPNSIKIGDEWFSLAGLEPVSTNVSGIATLVERYKAGELSDEDFSKSAIAFAQGVGAVLVNNSYLEGLSDIVSMGSGDPQQAQNAVTNFVAGLASSATTPAVLRAYTQSEDTAIRDTTGDGTLSDRIVGRIKSAVPGLSEQLPQRFDVYGRGMERNRVASPFVTRIDTRMEEDDPVIVELADLASKTDKVIVGPPQRTITTYNGEKRRLTAEEFQQYQQLSGFWTVEELRHEMADPYWNELDSEEKIEIIKEILADMRATAREYLFDTEEDDYEEDFF